MTEEEIFEGILLVEWLSSCMMSLMDTIDGTCGTCDDCPHLILEGLSLLASKEVAEAFGRQTSGIGRMAILSGDCNPILRIGETGDAIFPSSISDEVDSVLVLEFRGR